MKKLIFMVCVLLSCSGALATEQCPTTDQIKAMYAVADPLPLNKKMPYAGTNINDPICQFDTDINGNDIPGTGLWFVVTKIAVTDRGDPVKFVGFVIFVDANCTLTTSQAISEAKSIVAGITGEKGPDVNYPHFFIGSSGGVLYYFDVCLYEGSFNVANGTRDTDMDNVVVSAGSPVVMGDLSPGSSSFMPDRQSTRNFFRGRNAQRLGDAP